MFVQKKKIGQVHWVGKQVHWIGKELVGLESDSSQFLPGNRQKIGQQRKGKEGEIKADSKGEEICKDQRGKESKSQGGEPKEKRQSLL